MSYSASRSSVDTRRLLVDEARRRGVTIATAESCTAGMVASALADIPGSSAVLRGGAVTYCDEIKRNVLGVQAATLDVYTAVSEQTATEMAERARELFVSDLSVSLTGFAGPGGGSSADPVGTVYIAVCDKRGASVRRCSFQGDRNEVRRCACETALQLLLDVVLSM